MSPPAGKRVLITGASSGLGRVLAIEFARSQARLLLLARREPDLQETARLAWELGAEAIPLVGDVCLPESRSDAIRQATESFGGLDVLVNNAGVSAHGRFHESRPERLRRIMEVNLFAAAELIREATPLLREGNEPAVVNVGSILGWRAAPHNAEYSASKFALRGLSEAIRPELARLGVHVLHASPGTIDTEFFDHLVDKRGDLPWGKSRGVSPEFVARRIVRALEWRRGEVAIGWKAWWFIRASRLAPWLMDRVMSRYG